MPLLDLWTNSRDAVLGMNIQQIVSVAGEGKLLDQSDSSNELREYLSRVDREYLEGYARHCLEKSFEDNGLVLQDVINEVGRRFGMSVQNGIYRGKRQHNNCDGIWKSKGWTFVVEVKTTDAYSIRLDKIAAYLESEVSDEEEDHSSCLIVVGRQDTATLEDQLRGSRHNWKMRIVGVDALFKALELKELSEDPALTERIIELLKPREYTRVDHILSTAFDFASDREDALVEASNDYEEADGGNEVKQTRTVVTDRNQIEKLKVGIASRLAERFFMRFNRNRSMFENDENGIRFAIAVSKPYERRDRYWYAYHPRQMNFLGEAKEGFFVLGCADTNKAFAIPVDVMNDIASEMLTTSPNGDESKKYHHVVIRHEEGRYFIFAHPTKRELGIDKFLV